MVIPPMDRTPPRDVLEKLRKEVNLGCPVPGCGTPYLTWHHFDPPWRITPHHNPEGMVAMCATHAWLADGGRWTKEQLREMKRKPFVTADLISEFYGYLRKNVVCLFGNVAYRVKNILELNGERVIGFERDADGYDRLNLLIRNREGTPVLVMENNYWTAYSKELHDLSVSAQGKSLKIASKDGTTQFEMRFDDYPLSQFRELVIERQRATQIPEWVKGDARTWLEKSRRDTNSIDRFIQEIGAPDTVPTWSIRGRLSWGAHTLEIRDSEIQDERRNRFSMCFVVGGRTAFSYSSESMALGVAS
ncbi:MAG: hypothetical protein WCC94_12715 [Candidatus Bathyarchaeia archaeon]